MSDASQGPGWWQASDGNWYPPEQHPNYQPPAPMASGTLPPPTTAPPPPTMATSPGASTPADIVQQFRTVVPTGVLGKPRRPWVVAVFTVITLGIYGLYWQYASFKEMNDYSGQGIGGVLGLIFALLIGIVNLFLLPAEIANLYTREEPSRPVSATTGFWIFLPIVGWFVWVVKIQRALNRFWVAHGATGF
jgi:hypothetical protein